MFQPLLNGSKVEISSEIKFRKSSLEIKFRNIWKNLKTHLFTKI